MISASEKLTSQIRRLNILNPLEWGDTKKFLVHDIFSYSVMLAAVITADFWQNLMAAVNLNATTVPYNFGIFQILGAAYLLIHLLVSITRLKYYL